MAESRISDEDQFSCSICLDLLKDPVTIPCGHSYCMSCITDCWNLNDQMGVYSCPQCRQTFTPRPSLNKNVVLAEMVENLKKKKVQTARSALSYAGPGDVGCDVCTGTKRKAVKSCLVCLESYCQSHLECHEESPSRKRHKVTDATGRIQEMICSKHDRLLEVFCRTDKRCICLMCMLDEHKNHDTVSVEAERTEKQKWVGEMVILLQKRIPEWQTKIQELRESVQTHKRSAQATVEDSERVFTELILSIVRSRCEVTQMIRDQAKAESFQSLSVPPASKDSTVHSGLSYDDVRSSVSELRNKFENFCKEEIKKLSDEDSHQFTLDSESVHKTFRLSEGNRVATCTATIQQYRDHPNRFDAWPQVLCRESVCGRCYWEVEWSGSRGVGISVSHKSISRKGGGNECKFGCNDQSWRLFLSPSGYIISHNNIKSGLPVISSSSRIGVYVDHSAGILSFYSISDTMTLIHRVHTTFTQPLYPGFVLNKDSSVKLCHLEV
ncbi:E3 ubiquitin/ISG15 ligase TRIM25 [Anabarilius grahami]|uniref:E3 ubiquitin/ISG15 ligase TRIM25 n=1 Tax=Anabarilius grahami TaxID=495550 RepID=A0A3N0YPK3_ANAGA|nr:E3 ubiquitin/ISG15 ligase TRIM25 [Anabarilius grahami]